MFNFANVKIRVFNKNGLTEVATSYLSGKIGNAGKTMSFFIGFSENVENGFLEVKFLNTNDVFEAGNPENKMGQQSYIIHGVNFYRGENEE